MSKEHGPFSMSFMDVITCGMGSLLLLFLIQIATRQDLEDSRKLEDQVTKDQETAPFAIVILGPARKDLWENPHRNPFRIDGDLPPESRIRFGKNFAILTADRPFDPRTKVAIGPLVPGIQPTIHYFLNQDRIGSVSGKAPDGPGHMLSVWPTEIVAGDAVPEGRP